MDVKNLLNFRGSPLRPTHPDLEIIENINLGVAVGVAADHRNPSPGMVLGDTRDHSARREVAKMGQMGITADSAVVLCGLPEWGRMGADDQMGEAPQCPRNNIAKIPGRFAPELVHPADKVVTGQAREVPNPVLIGALDDGASGPTGTAVGPSAVTYECRVSR